MIVDCIKCANKITVPLVYGPSDLSMKCEYCSSVQYFVDSGGINLARWLIQFLLILIPILLSQYFTFSDVVFFVGLSVIIGMVIFVNYYAYSYASKHKELRTKRGVNRL